MVGIRRVAEAAIGAILAACYCSACYCTAYYCTACYCTGCTSSA